MLSKNISKQLNSLIKPVVDELGFELVGISQKQENSRSILEIIIDKEQGITLDDCALVSEKISLLLDVEDIFQNKYYLEVGSPGIFRELTREQDFKRSLGKRIKANLKNPVKGQRQWVGMLKVHADQRIIIGVAHGEIPIDLDNIKSIQLFPDI